MTKISSLTIRPTVRGLVLALAVAALSSYVARAVPYASCITNNAGNVSYYLNEAATDVKIIFDGGGVGKSNTLGPQAKGLHADAFSMAGHTSYEIQVTQIATVGWTRTSDDANLFCAYPSPRGVAVNKISTNLSTFGRIYVSDSLTNGVVASVQRANAGKGIFILNADQSDCLGRSTNASQAGMSFLGGSQSSPWKIDVGQDNKLYVNCFATVDATTWRSDPDCNSFELVLEGVGENVNTTVHTDFASKPIVTGSTADSSLKLWSLDGAMRSPSGSYNSIAEWDILGEPLPWNTPPTFVGTATAYSSVADVICDFDRGPDGKWFILVNRSAGTDRASIQEYDTDGTTLLFDSFSFYGSPDPLRGVYGCAVSPDGKTFAFIRGTDNAVFMYSLTNGVIDTSTQFIMTQDNVTGTGRAITWDAAGNIYTVSSGQARLRVFAPGGFTVATTGSDGTFVVAKPSSTVSVTATTPITSMDITQPLGVFTLTRVGDTTAILPVGYTLTGTATNNVQYQLLSGTVTFQPGDTSTNVFVTPIPFTPAGPTRSVILTINTSNTYAPASPLSDTVWIIDTNKPSIHVAIRDTQFYERTNDYARFTLTRWGDTNIYLGQINVTYGGGSAVDGTHFYGFANTNMNAGDVTQDVYVFPIYDGVVTGPLTVKATVGAALDASYNVGAPATSGAVVRVDADDPPETVLWSDNLRTDTSASWTQLFATTNDAPYDATVDWAYDYSGIPVPSAPHSGGDTHGLHMTVNKNDSQLAAAALNFYPNGKSFSGNYALRFDMFLIMNDTSGTTEYALFGINHSGTKTNWFRNSTTGFNGVDPVGWSFDGVFYDVESDGSALGDYVGYSSPTTAGHNPTPINVGRGASTLTGVFKYPPWTGGAGTGGAAANTYASATPIWADVELKQLDGVIYWSINHTLIFAYTNTTGYTSGNIMLGYTDGYDSIGSSGGSVIYANARVISLNSLARPVITRLVMNVGNAEITFTGNAGDVVGQFVLQTASEVNGAYADTTSTLSSLGSGAFKAVKAVGPANQFYRIRRIE